ncbi:hypothetical protein F5887DRAFT_964170 [Amanita rubescens]|nr:hypothetical protein F5887DRAFT_964170 [Amanita rubescens]
MRRITQLVVLLCCLAFCFDLASSAPVRAKRQNKPGQVTTTSVVDTPNGPMTQTCTVTLTPTTDSSGAPAFQEVKSCNLSPVNPNGTSSATLSPTAGSSVSPAQGAKPIPLSPPATTPPVVTAPPAANPGTTSTATSNTSTPSPTTSPTPTTSPVPSSSPTTTPGFVSPTSSSASSLTSSTTPTSTASAAADKQAPPTQSAAQAFKIPGKTLSVLPIGLGVFAAILVIALIVVGLVTYERTKYRKAFRQRRLAETGSSMGQV